MKQAVNTTLTHFHTVKRAGLYLKNKIIVIGAALMMSLHHDLVVLHIRHLILTAVDLRRGATYRRVQ